LLEEDGEFFPLLLGGVDAGGVVGAGVEENDTSVWSSEDGLFHAGKVEAFGFFGKVGVGCDGQFDVGEDLVVVCPGGVAEIDRGRSGEEACEEESTQVNSTSAGDGLDGMCALF